MNSREKGKRGERQWRDELRANGYAARRGQQFTPPSSAITTLNVYDGIQRSRRTREFAQQHLCPLSGLEIRNGNSFGTQVSARNLLV